MTVRQLERNDVQSVTWEYYEPPRYRVDFWKQFDASPGTPQEKMGYKQDSYEISDVKDVFEVCDWADADAARRSYVVYVMFQMADDVGMVRVYGDDPTRPRR